MDLLSGSTFIALAIAWIVVRALLYHSRREKARSAVNLPPGPTPLPIIGNLLHLGERPYKSLANLSKTYGPIMSLKLGQVTTVIISSSNFAKEVLQTHDQLLSNRTIPDSLSALNHDEFSLPWIPVSPRWRTLRKICATHLFSGKVLDANESLRRKKVEEVIAEIRKSAAAGNVVDIGESAFRTTLNLLSNTMYSVDLADPDSDTAKNFKETVYNIMKEAGRPNLGDFFPLLRKIDPHGSRRRMATYFGMLLRVFRNLINERVNSRKSLSTDDMLDTLLRISEENSEEMDKTKIEHLSLDLFAAGTDTSTSTVEWAMAELLRNTHIMSKSKVELREIIGEGNAVQESDIPRLPYLRAIRKETFRLYPAVPLLLPRKVEADVDICGFTLPKEAMIFVNAWAIGRDPSRWEDSDVFDPERFMGPGAEVDVRGRNFELIPFGGGRRICPGLPLAMRMLHVMVGSFVNCFDWKLEDGVRAETMCMKAKPGLTLVKYQPVRAIPCLLSLDLSSKLVGDSY